MKLEIFNSHLVTNHPKSYLDIYNRLSIKGKYEVTILSFATNPLTFALYFIQKARQDRRQFLVDIA